MKVIVYRIGDRVGLVSVARDVDIDNSAAKLDGAPEFRVVEISELPTAPIERWLWNDGKIDVSPEPSIPESVVMDGIRSECFRRISDLLGTGPSVESFEEFWKKVQGLRQFAEQLQSDYSEGKINVADLTKDWPTDTNQKTP